jgi:hypothetical protein
MAQMAAGKPVVIGADLEVTGQGKTTRIKPTYWMNPATGEVGQVMTALPGGGAIGVARIDASSGAVEFQTADPRLSIDVTHKPLILLVWGGLWIVLIGGLMSTANRLRESRLRDRLAAAKA